MPRDAQATRAALIEAGRSVFARSGFHAASLKELTALAGQKNASALQYHFGSRGGLLNAILDLHNHGIETVRKAMLDRVEPEPTLRDLVEAVVIPQVHYLATPDGRQCLSIVSQLTDMFDRWDVGNTPEQALRAFRAIYDALPAELPDPLRHERVTRFLELACEALGSRARLLDSARSSPISDELWANNLIDMAVGALSA